MGVGFKKGCLVLSYDEWHMRSHVFACALRSTHELIWTSESIVVISRKEMILISVRTDS